jgi:hypothetical protein
MTVVAKSVDDDCPESSVVARRGYGGLAIFGTKEIDDKIKVMDEMIIIILRFLIIFILVIHYLITAKFFPFIYSMLLYFFMGLVYLICIAAFPVLTEQNRTPHLSGNAAIQIK